jgi:hypothetical protein
MCLSCSSSAIGRQFATTSLRTRSVAVNAKDYGIEKVMTGRSQVFGETQFYSVLPANAHSSKFDAVLELIVRTNDRFVDRIDVLTPFLQVEFERVRSCMKVESGASGRRTHLFFSASGSEKAVSYFWKLRAPTVLKVITGLCSVKGCRVPSKNQRTCSIDAHPMLS